MSDPAVGTTGTIDVSKYMYQIRKLKGALATTSAERDTVRNERDALKVRADDQAKQLEASKNNKEVIELRGVFDRVAKAKGIRDDALDATYQLGKYVPPDGDVDEEALGTAIDEQ